VNGGRPETPVIATAPNGDEIHFVSLTAAGEAGFVPSCIHRCIEGRRNTHAGYTWRRDSRRNRHVVGQELTSLKFKHALLMQWLQGDTFLKIGEHYGFSKQRAHQLVQDAIRVSHAKNLRRGRRDRIADVDQALKVAELKLQAEYESHR
jgi:hypothetical protein